MIRFIAILGIASLVGLAAFVYRFKYESTALTRQSQQLVRDIKIEREAIAALRAQYSTLAKPSRLQGLSERHLKHLKPLTVAQLATPSEVPERLPDLGLFIDKLTLGVGLPVVDTELGSPTGASRKPILPPSPRPKISRPIP